MLAGWMAGIRRRERVFIGVELLLSPDVDLVLRASGKHVIRLSVVRHGRDPALGKSTHRLLLLGGRDRYDLKTRLREQGLFLGDNVAVYRWSDTLLIAPGPPRYRRYLLMLIVFSYMFGLVVCVGV